MMAAVVMAVSNPICAAQTRGEKTTTPIGASAHNQQPPPSDEPLIFRQFELPQLHIGNCVALYNNGLYEEPSATAECGGANRLGLTSAFERTPPHLLIASFLPKMRRAEKRREVGKAVTKLVHLVPHKHSDVLHHVHCQREMTAYPLKYFVAIRHSGYSIGPRRPHVWANHPGVEEKEQEMTTAAAYDLPANICFEPWRLERTEDLEIHPLRACCSFTKIAGRRKSSDAEADKRRIIARIHLRRKRSPSIRVDESANATDGSAPLINNDAGAYGQLTPALEMSNAALEDFVQKSNAEDVAKTDERKYKKGIATNFLHICTKPQIKEVEEKIGAEEQKEEREAYAGPYGQLTRALDMPNAAMEDFVQKSSTEDMVQTDERKSKKRIAINLLHICTKPQIKEEEEIGAEEQKQEEREADDAPYGQLTPAMEMPNAAIEEFVQKSSSFLEGNPTEAVSQTDGRKSKKGIATNFLHICTKSQIKEEQEEPAKVEEKGAVEVFELLRRNNELASCSMVDFVNIVVVDANPLPQPTAHPSTTEAETIERRNKCTAKIFIRTHSDECADDKNQHKKHRKDKQKDGKKEKKTKKAIGAASTSSSSSSSSSSSTDAEAEEVHLLYHHPGQKQQQHDVPFGNEQTQKVTMTSAPYTLVVDPNLFDPIQHTTVETWHEEKIGPEQVTTEIDEEGNIIKRITRTEQIRHTVQTQSFEPVLVDEIENSAPAQPLRQNVPPPPPARRSVVFENGHKGQNGVSDESGELVSTKVVTTGNRTVETLTYKTEKDGMSETRVEHRITIHSNEEIDHDAELSRAILEATSMNPELKVEKVEVDRGGLKK